MSRIARTAHTDCPPHGWRRPTLPCGVCLPVQWCPCDPSRNAFGVPRAPPCQGGGVRVSVRVTPDRASPARPNPPYPCTDRHGARNTWEGAIPQRAARVSGTSSRIPISRTSGERCRLPCALPFPVGRNLRAPTRGGRISMSESVADAPRGDVVSAPRWCWDPTCAVVWRPACPV